MKNLAFIQSNLSKWITNDPDSRKKKSLYLAIVQGYYLQLKNTMSLVGGVVCQESRLSTSLPRYQVVPKAKQREAFQWLLRQAKDFQGKADRNFERKGFIDVSYYDQLLEFLVKDIYDLRSRIIIASQVDSKTYSLGEYFDDLYQATFASTIAGKSPNHMERLMQIAFIDKSIAGTVNPRNATPGMPYSFAGAPASVGGKLISLTSTTDYSDALKSGRVKLWWWRPLGKHLSYGQRPSPRYVRAVHVRCPAEGTPPARAARCLHDGPHAQGPLPDLGLQGREAPRC